MGTDLELAEETLSYHYSFKVHHSMCTELKKVVDRIDHIFPDIEDARPRCKSGIQQLCSLTGAIDTAKKILVYCSESSKLYLVLTGDVILSRCQKARRSLDRSLTQIQSMVPVMLAAEISHIIEDIRSATFMLDFLEEEAGRAIHDLLHSESDLLENCEIKFQSIASTLHITSKKAILIEKRSIKKLLQKVSDKDSAKEKILKFFLALLKRYENSIKGEQNENPNSQRERLSAIMEFRNSSAYNRTVESESRISSENSNAQADVLSEPTLPEEFRCPISKRLMYDPVIISSGETFERMWIQKWLEEGNDVCPKTKEKLAHYHLTPNTVMKELITKWCEKYDITVLDPSMEAFESLDISTTSVASLGISMNDLRFPLDVSNVSFGSLDNSYSSDSSRIRVTEGSRLMQMQKNDDSHGFQSDHNLNVKDIVFMSKLAELSWETQCKVVEDVTSHLQYNDRLSDSLSMGNCSDPLIRFLRDACNHCDLKAQRSGLQLLLAVLSKNGSGIACLNEDAFSLIASYLDSEVVEEALTVLEVLSGNSYCRSKIVESGALNSIIKFLGSGSQEFHEQAIKILHNLSSNKDIGSQIVYLGCVQKLVPFLNDGDLTRTCISLLKVLCDTEEGRAAVAEIDGCLKSICYLLDSESSEVQEQAVGILLSLCSQRIQYCHLVMHEGIIPALCLLSINGSDKAKVSAQELLRQLRDLEYDNEQESIGSGIDAVRCGNKESKGNKSSSKSHGILHFFSRGSKSKV